MSAGFTVVALLMAFLAQGLYRDFFESVLKLALSEEYSYMVVSLSAVLTVTYLSVRSFGFSCSVRISKLLASVSIASLAFLAYLLSRLSPELQAHLQGLSFTLLFLSAVGLVYDPLTPARVAPMLTVFLLVPLPTSVADSITPALSRVVGRLAAALTGSRLVETRGYVMLEVGTSSGTQLLSVEAVCSGVLTLGSVVAAVPALVLLASMGRAEVSRRTTASLAAVASALAVGFLGNLVRVLLVVHAAHTVGVGEAMDALRYSPSLIYSSVSAITAFLIALRYGGLEVFGAPKREAGKGLDVSWSYALGVIAIAVVVVSAASAAILAAGGPADVGGKRGLSIAVGNLESLLESPAAYFGAGEVVYLSALYDGYLTRVLGALAAYRVTMEFSGSVYQGYLELVDTPARLHTWQLCLAAQGYEVFRSWSRSYGTLQVSYVTARADGGRYLLAYAVVPVTVRTGAVDQRLFARLSVFTPFEDLTEAVESSTKLIIAAAGGSSEGVELEALSAAYAVSYALLALLLAYSLFVGIRHAYYLARARGVGLI